MQHEHTSSDVAPGTVTLCATSPSVDGGLRWAHVPVDQVLWANESLRDAFRERVRREVGNEEAPIEVLGAEE